VPKMVTGLGSGGVISLEMTGEVRRDGRASARWTREWSGSKLPATWSM
jgi:hypothetical protein